MTSFFAPPGSNARMQAINSRLQASDWAGAAGLAEKALAAGDRGPLLHKLRALARQQAGRWAEAAEDLRVALAAWPQDFAAWNMLAACEARAGRPAAAVQASDRALALKPDYVPALVNKAWALELMGEIVAARAAYLAAETLSPADPRPRASLALLDARAGDWTAARARAASVLAEHPAHAPAEMAMAMAVLGEGDVANALDRFERLLSRPGLDAHQAAVAEGFRGDALDKLHRPADAFAAFAEANRRLVVLYPQEGRESGSAKARRLAEAFAALPEPPMPDRSPDPHRPPLMGHVFLLGFPRSGTTLLGQVLDAHRAVTTLDERENLAEAAAAFQEPGDGLVRLADASPAEIDRFRAAYWRRVTHGAPDLAGRTFVDKLPLNTFGLPLIARLFPGAKVIFMRRDPRDIVLSCFRQRFVAGSSTAEFATLASAARFYDSVMALADAYRARLSLDVHDQSYEALVAGFEEQTRALCVFLGLDWDPAMEAFSGGAKSVATPSAVQLSRGLYRDGAGQWRRYAAQMQEVLPILAPWVARFGYEAA
jgi:tetratricopeptide (TPR) repeat protein